MAMSPVTSIVAGLTHLPEAKAKGDTQCLANMLISWEVLIPWAAHSLVGL